MTPDQARNVLDRLLHPISSEAFVAEIIDSSPYLVLPRSTGGFLDKLLGNASIPALAEAYKVLGPRAVLRSRAPAGAAPSLVVDDAAAFTAALQQSATLGYTIQFREVETAFPELAQLRTAFDIWFSGFVEIDIFWSGPNCSSGGHSDPYDVLVIQVEGAKTWRIARDDAGLPNNWPFLPPQKKKPPRDFDTVNLRAGDLLYVRRGQFHDVSSEGPGSLHIAIAFRPLTRRDVVAAIVDFLADHDRQWREYLKSAEPFPLIEGQSKVDWAVTLGKLSDQLSEACRSTRIIDEALVWSRARMLDSRPALEPASPFDENAADGMYQLRKAAVYSLRRTEDKIIVTGPGRHLTLPLAAAPATEFILREGQFRPKDLPGGMTENSQAVLTQRLIDAGLIEPCLGF